MFSFSFLFAQKQNTNITFSELCLQHRKVFLHEQQLYPSKSAINKHNEIGDPVLKLKPHPPCKYCNKLYYSDEELFRHCEDTHFKCFICERDNLLFHYFRDYDHLVWGSYSSYQCQLHLTTSAGGTLSCQALFVPRKRMSRKEICCI